VRWQGELSEVSSLDLAADVTTRALDQLGVDRSRISDITLGITIPQPAVFYGAPTLAARVGVPTVSGPMIAQACATSVACLQWAAATLDDERETCNLVVATDRLSNGPHLVFPRPSGMGGYPDTEDWVLDNFKKDPWAGEPMIVTAEAVASEGGFARAQIDEVCALRHEQYRTYQSAVDGHPPYMIPAHVHQRRGEPHIVDHDQGVHETTLESLASLRPVQDGGVVTYGTQTHPADGTAGAIVTSESAARRMSGRGVVELLAAATARVEPARMPKATVPAAAAALEAAGMSIDAVDLVGTHNPFAVNDLWFSREMGFPLDRMNLYGCSLVYGHPQAATGLRGVVELIAALTDRGGGVGLFTGCAAGDTAGAILLKVQD
jgi:acetyl-CoA C-acetyltransferase